MLTPTGVKILDFGISAVTGEPDDDETGATFGTPAYVAPERLDGKPAEPATDVYGLGVLLFEMVTGQPPYPVDTWEELAPARAGGAAALPAVLAARVPRAGGRCLVDEPDAAGRPPAAVRRPTWPVGVAGHPGPARNLVHLPAAGPATDRGGAAPLHRRAGSRRPARPRPAQTDPSRRAAAGASAVRCRLVRSRGGRLGSVRARALAVLGARRLRRRGLVAAAARRGGRAPPPRRRPPRRASPRRARPSSPRLASPRRQPRGPPPARPSRWTSTSRSPGSARRSRPAGTTGRSGRTSRWTCSTCSGRWAARTPGEADDQLAELRRKLSDRADEGSVDADRAEVLRSRLADLGQRPGLGLSRGPADRTAPGIPDRAGAANEPGPRAGRKARAGRAPAARPEPDQAEAGGPEQAG